MQANALLHKTARPSGNGITFQISTTRYNTKITIANASVNRLHHLKKLSPLWRFTLHPVMLGLPNL
jgi:hypothetical protein